ncbi:MAG: efflux RND transporter permease subunit [Ignavibacteria bacterium]|jgi:multidrug efflux pump subunit AcrB
MKTKKTLLDHILSHKQFILVITVILIAVGVIALIQMPRDEFPEFEVRQGLIIGVYPGASSSEVEEQLTKKVESYLFEYEEVDKEKTHSISKENLMIIFVEVQTSVNEPKIFWTKIRHGLNELKRELPSGVMSLTANDDFGNTSAMLLTVESETKTYKELEDYIEKFEDDVRKIPSTSRVKHYGLQKEEINIYMDDAKLTHYGIKPLTLLGAIQPQGTINYAGEIDDGNTISPIHIPSNYKTENDIANQIIYSDQNGNVVRVKDVAKVVREYEEPDSYIRVNGKKCLVVSLEMLPEHNIVQYGSEVKEAIDKFKSEVPSDVNVAIISDMPHFISTAIFNFLKEFGIAIVAVILVTIILLPRKVAVVAASAIPISILITLGFLWAAGIALETVSLAGLIVVLGMVVDNAIVIIDNYVEKLDNDISPYDAASQCVYDLFGSVFSATLILIFSFLPMVLFMTGMAADFVKSLPFAITFALIVSLVVSVILIPMMSYIFIKTGIKGKQDENDKKSFLTKLQSFYNNLVEKVFTMKKTIVLLGATSFIIGIGLLAIVPQQSFPAFDRNQFAVEVYLPTGSSLEQTDSVMRQVEELLMKDERVEEVAAFVGTGSPRFNTLYAPHFPQKNYGQLLVITESSEATLEILDEYAKEYTDYIPNAHIKWKQLEMTKFGFPVEIRISGDSISTIKRVADEIAEMMRSFEGAKWVRDDYEEPLRVVELNLKEDRVSRLGYSKMILDNSLMIGTGGLPVATIWEDDYPIDVNLRVDKRKKTNINEVMNQYVTSPYLVSSTQVRQLADAKQGYTEGEIARRNGVRTITVAVDVARGYYPSKIIAESASMIDEMQFPEGISISYGGEVEQQEEAVTPLYYSFAVTVAIIFLILLFQFRSSKTAFLIMTTMPLSLFGASFGVLVTGYPFSVTALIGLIGLMGIVVRNGIIYISYVEELRFDKGMSLEEAAIAGAKRRMRPIFLTAAAAAVGVIPMILSGSNLWGPLGSVICFGLIFGLVLSLVVLPVLYYLFNKNDQKQLKRV